MALEKYKMDFQTEVPSIHPISEKPRRKVNDYRSKSYYRDDFFESKSKRSRKRNSAIAELADPEEFSDIINSLKDLKLMPVSKERLEIADKLFKTPELVTILVNSLPEQALRQMAMTCTEWRNQAYSMIRQRSQNKVFSIVWTGIISGTESINLNFRDFFNSWFVRADSPNQFWIPTVSGKNLEIMDMEDTYTSSSFTVTSSEARVLTKQRRSLNPAGFILTYGTANMEDCLKLEGENGRTNGMYPENCVSMFVTSDCICVTSPKRLAPTLLNVAPSSGANTGLLSSLMFPACTHLVIESFLVPLMFTKEDPCSSQVFGFPSPSTVPKALILFQSLNLAEIDPGIVDVLQGLKTTAGSAGFPMVTATYDWIDGDMQTESLVADPVVSGMLISGDEFCNTFFISLNIITELNDWGLYLSKMQEFYDANNYSCQIAMLFYHNDALKIDGGGNMYFFKMFMQRFREKFPKVKVHGIGSLSGSHTEVITTLSADVWKEINRNMVSMTGNAFASCYKLDFVLMAYNAD